MWSSHADHKTIGTCIYIHTPFVQYITTVEKHIDTGDLRTWACTTAKCVLWFALSQRPDYGIWALYIYVHAHVSWSPL